MKKIMILVLLTVFLVGCQKEVEDINEFDMTAKRFEFNPDKLIVNKGERVVINIKSLDVEHGFTIDEYGINEMIGAEEEIVIDFIANKAGLFNFYSSIYSGPGYGAMRGQLIVVEE